MLAGKSVEPFQTPSSSPGFRLGLGQCRPALACPGPPPSSEDVQGIEAFKPDRAAYVQADQVTKIVTRADESVGSQTFGVLTRTSISAEVGRWVDEKTSETFMRGSKLYPASLASFVLPMAGRMRWRAREIEP